MNGGNAIAHIKFQFLVINEQPAVIALKIIVTVNDHLFVSYFGTEWVQ